MSGTRPGGSLRITRTRRRVLIQLHTVVSRRRRSQLYSTAMRAYVNTVSLTAVCVIACIVNLAPVVAECTRRHDDVSVLTTMVTRLQHSVDQLSYSVEHQLEHLTKLEDTLAKQNELLKRLVPASDCYELQKDGNAVSGVYEIYLDKARKYVQVYCDMETDGGGWLVFQRRQDGSVNFYRDWADYKEGFGNVSGEFWLGNDYLHDLTSQTHYTLRIDMEDFENNTRYAVYSKFTVASEADKYKLSLGVYNGTAGDSLTSAAGNSFSTKDRDSDVASQHCAQLFKGAWWYKTCHLANLNGLYLGGPHTSYADGIEWSTWHDYHYSLKKVDMKLRP